MVMSYEIVCIVCLPVMPSRISLWRCTELGTGWGSPGAYVGRLEVKLDYCITTSYVIDEKACVQVLSRKGEAVEDG